MKEIKWLFLIFAAIFITYLSCFGVTFVNFIDAVVGKNNRYGYPSNTVIKRFKTKKIPLYRTDIDGTIIIQTDGNIISIEKKSDKNYL